MKVRQGVFMLIEHNHRFLIAHNVSHQSDEWRIPGGGKEQGETSLECFYREAQEELALLPKDFSKVQPLGISYKYEWPKELQEKYATWGQEKELVHALLHSPDTIVLGNQNELDAIAWVTKEELFEREPWTKSLLESIL